MIYINLYKDYQELYPNWSIPPDVSAGDSLYIQDAFHKQVQG